MLNGLSVVRIVIILFPVVSTIRPPDPIPLLQPHYRPSSLLLIGPSQCSASVFSPRGFRRLCFSLVIRALVPAVPHRSLHPVHAPSTPVTVCPVNQVPDRLVPVELLATGFDDACFLTTRRRRVCFRSSPGRTPAQDHAPSFPSNAHDHGFLTTAAWSGLGPAPESRSRGACPHLPRSCTTALIVSYPSFLSVSAAHNNQRRMITGIGTPNNQSNTPRPMFLSILVWR